MPSASGKSHWIRGLSSEFQEYVIDGDFPDQVPWAQPAGNEEAGKEEQAKHLRDAERHRRGAASEAGRAG